MQRVFTRKVGKRFKAGDVRDYPPTTWNQIAISAKLKLDTFSQPVATMLQKKAPATMALDTTDQT